MPPNKSAAFKGYHLPFIGYTYTENSLLNDCHSIMDYVSEEALALTTTLTTTTTTALLATTTTTTTTVTQKNGGEEVLLSEVEEEGGQKQQQQQLLGVEYKELVGRLESEKLELLAKLKLFESKDPALAPTAEVELEVDVAQQAAIAGLKEQVAQLGGKLAEMNTLYESTKQSELEEKNKIKHLERSVRALKIEKDQLFTVSDLDLEHPGAGHPL